MGGVVPEPRRLDALAELWRSAFETARAALSAAAPYIDGRELARWSRRLDEELSDVARLLQGLAGEPQ
jgi:hypothetical protein